MFVPIRPADFALPLVCCHTVLLDHHTSPVYSNGLKSSSLHEGAHSLPAHAKRFSGVGRGHVICCQFVWFDDRSLFVPIHDLLQVRPCATPPLRGRCYYIIPFESTGIKLRQQVASGFLVILLFVTAARFLFLHSFPDSVVCLT